MKSEGALRMRFLRHDKIFRSDVSLLLVSSGRGAASRWSGPAQAVGRDGRNAPCPSSSMSFDRLFLDRVARQQSPSPLYRQPQNKSLAVLLETFFQPTATTPLTSCLTLGVQFSTAATSDSLPGLVPALSGSSLIRFPTGRSCLHRTEQGLSGELDALSLRAIVLYTVPATRFLSRCTPSHGRLRLQGQARPGNRSS